MYTEDDHEVTVKEDNSNAEYSDFYTSFNDIDDEKKKKKSEKKKKKVVEKPKEVEVKEERDYSDFYGTNDKNNDTGDDTKKNNIIKIIVASALFVILIILIIVLIVTGNKKVTGDIELSNSDITINIGDSGYISYKVINTESSVISTFTSSNPSIATVSNEGEIKGMGIGDAVITISYTIDNVTKEKKCNVKVNNDKNVNQNVSLVLKFEKGSENTWTNGDIVINTEAASIFGVESIKYAINCDDNCNYTDVTGNKINISINGTTKVKVVARDKKNQETTKEVIVKIDKEAPTVTLNSSRNIKSDNNVEVCATCSDNLSGCKQGKVCKKYTSSKSNQVIIVEDLAGNKKISESFNVTINKKTVLPSCSLSVSSKGVVTANTKGDLKYYGFNSKYTGNNTNTMQVSINATKAGEKKAQLINYYVKDKDGNTAKCDLVVIKECKCTSGNKANCPVTCTYSSQ